MKHPLNNRAEMKFLRMRRLLRAWLVVLVIAAAIGAVGLLFYPPSPGLTVDNYVRLHKGMSQERVHQILGSEPHYDFYCTGGRQEIWVTSKFRIELWFSCIFGNELFDGKLIADDGTVIPLSDRLIVLLRARWRTFSRSVRL